MALEKQYRKGVLEAGLDEAGRGCLAGPVVAAAVVLPKDFDAPTLNDSKQLSEAKREALRKQIIEEAVTWAVAFVSPERIDEINILKASFEAMCKAIDELEIKPEALLVDGNRFVKHSLPYTCMVKGDSRFQNIAAASILAKTFRDDHMRELDRLYPYYDWARNKGYPTATHRKALQIHGVSPYHRKSFQLLPPATLF